MYKMWYTKDLFGRDEREIMVWTNRLNHCTFKSHIVLSKRVIIFNNISRVGKLPPCMDYIFVKSHRKIWRDRGKRTGGYIRKPS